MFLTVTDGLYLAVNQLIFVCVNFISPALINDDM